mgnify:CR=1 FL=1|jgi:hypothetical protein
MNAPTNNNFHINKNGRVTMFCILQTVFTNEKIHGMYHLAHTVVFYALSVFS